MHFIDLTPYTYRRLGNGATILNVGWLSGGQPFDTGAVAPELTEKLKLLCENPILRTAGAFYCPFCSTESPAAGAGEIRVEGQDGKCYAAPSLVYHYVTQHGYRPPQEFLEAIQLLPSDSII